MEKSTKLKQRIAGAIRAFRSMAFYTSVIFCVAGICVILISSNYAVGALCFVLALLSLLWLTPIPFYRKVASESERRHSQETSVLRLCSPSVKSLVLLREKPFSPLYGVRFDTTDICTVIKDKKSGEWYLLYSTTAQAYGLRGLKINLKNGSAFPRIYKNTHIVKDFVTLTTEGEYKEINPLKNIIGR